jgi:nitrate reductase gamma subunit
MLSLSCEKKAIIPLMSALGLAYLLASLALLKRVIEFSSLEEILCLLVLIAVLTCGF